MVKRKKQQSEEKRGAGSNANSHERSGENFVDIGRPESEDYEPSVEVRNEFDQAARLGTGSRQRVIDELLENKSTSRSQSEADVEAAWEAGDVGGESVESGNPTPDQNVVDDLGKAVGLIYEDDEPLQTTDKVAARDQHRWELDPASSEGFNDRTKHEGEYEEK